MNALRRYRCPNRKGSVIILLTFSLFVILGIAALVIDLGMLYAARNELQNAADAGALAGAAMLYDETGVNTGANQVAFDAATANTCFGTPVDVEWTSGTNLSLIHI